MRRRLGKVRGVLSINACMATISALYVLFLYSADDINLQSILAFFTGAEAIPSTGFQPPPTLRFSHSNVLPTASTCAVSLTLPTCYHDKPDTFRQKMVFAITHHGGFGLR